MQTQTFYSNPTETLIPELSKEFDNFLADILRPGNSDKHSMNHSMNDCVLPYSDERLDISGIIANMTAPDTSPVETTVDSLCTENSSKPSRAPPAIQDMFPTIVSLGNYYIPTVIPGGLWEIIDLVIRKGPLSVVKLWEHLQESTYFKSIDAIRHIASHYFRDYNNVIDEQKRNSLPIPKPILKKSKDRGNYDISTSLTQLQFNYIRASPEAATESAHVLGHELAKSSMNYLKNYTDCDASKPSLQAEINELAREVFEKTDNHVLSARDQSVLIRTHAHCSWRQSKGMDYRAYPAPQKLTSTLANSLAYQSELQRKTKAPFHHCKVGKKEYFWSKNSLPRWNWALPFEFAQSRLGDLIKRRWRADLEAAGYQFTPSEDEFLKPFIAESFVIESEPALMVDPMELDIETDSSSEVTPPAKLLAYQHRTSIGEESGPREFIRVQPIFLSSILGIKNGHVVCRQPLIATDILEHRTCDASLLDNVEFKSKSSRCNLKYISQWDHAEQMNRSFFVVTRDIAEGDRLVALSSAPRREKHSSKRKSDGKRSSSKRVRFTKEQIPLPLFEN